MTGFYLFIFIVIVCVCHSKISRNLKKLSPSRQFPANLSVSHIHPYILSLDGWTFRKNRSYPIRSAGKHPTFLRIWRKSRGLFFPFYPLYPSPSLWWRDMERGVEEEQECGRKVAEPEVNTRCRCLSLVSVKVRRLVSGESSSHFGLFMCKCESRD